MHESGMMRDLVNKICDVAKQYEGRLVSKVYLRVGLLQVPSADHLLEHFKIAATGTLCESAKVEMELCSDLATVDPCSIVLTGIEFDGSP